MMFNQNSTFPGSIVAVDDDPLALQAIKFALGSKYELATFEDPQKAEAHLKDNHTDLILLDLNLRHSDGRTWLPKWNTLFPDTEIVFCSGEQSVEKAVSCLREGAADYVVKPFKRVDLQLIVNRVFQKIDLTKKAEKLRSIVTPYPVDFVAGHSAKIQYLLTQIQKLKGQSHINVLLLGESGTGKEMIARLLHQQELDSNRPFVVANMPAIPPQLMEAELFGVEKGAYTDAKVSRAGKFEQAHGGDIFLDEIGDLPAETQAKILRTIQEKQVQRVGGNRTRNINFRVISATNQPLYQMTEKGQFRKDLLYRLNDLVVEIPPLRERVEDIPELASHFLRKYSNGQTKRISPKAMDQLQEHKWPGNVRELESTLKRAVLFSEGQVLETIEISNQSSLPVGGTEVNYHTAINRHERDLFRKVLEKHAGNRQAAMKELNLSRATFYRKLQRLNLS